MIYAVNLLPESCHNVRRRAARQTAWTITTACAALLVVGMWIGLQAIDHALTRQERELGGIQIKQTELDRQLMFAMGERNALADRARALAALRCDSDADGLPVRLTELARLAPEGIVLTELRSVPADLAASIAPAPTKPAAAGQTAPTGPTHQELNAQISGFATNHAELTHFIDIVVRCGFWERVELVRAATEPFQSGQALSFRLDCQHKEEAK